MPKSDKNGKANNLSNSNSNSRNPPKPKKKRKRYRGGPLLANEEFFHYYHLKWESERPCAKKFKDEEAQKRKAREINRRNHRERSPIAIYESFSVHRGSKIRMAVSREGMEGQKETKESSRKNDAEPSTKKSKSEKKSQDQNKQSKRNKKSETKPREQRDRWGRKQETSPSLTKKAVSFQL